MIEYKTGDILQEEAEALVNTVNCVGVMGKGIALQFKRAWPDNFKAYAAACKREEVQPGRPFVFETGRLTNPKLIINFPTKRHWRGKSRIEDITSGLEALAAEIRQRGIRSVAVPPLGSGLGGLQWREVRQQIERVLGDLADVRIVVFEPHATPAEGEEPAARKTPRMTPGRAVLVRLIDRYLRGLLDPEVSLLEIHKLMYFMQEAGEDLRLRLKKAEYGPYAENLRHVLAAVDGHFISGYGGGGEEPRKTLELVPGVVEDAERALAENPETKARFERVSELVEGFESPFGLELLATVLWVATREGAATEDQVVTETYAWSPRKSSQFSRQQIQLARRILAERGWIEVEAA